MTSTVAIRSAFAMALFISVIAGGSAHASPYRSALLNTYTDYGQDSFKPTPSTRVAWFTTMPVVLSPATVAVAPDPVYIEPAPPPAVAPVMVPNDQAY